MSALDHTKLLAALEIGLYYVTTEIEAIQKAGTWDQGAFDAAHDQRRMIREQIHALQTAPAERET